MGTAARRLAFAFCMCVLLHAAEPLAGTWKRNPAKSKYMSGPPPQELTIVITPASGSAYLFKVNGMMGDGRKVAVSYTASIDGKQAPITGDPRYTTVAVRKVDENTYDTIFYKDGKVVRTDRSVFSDEGRVRTITSRDADMKVVAVSVDEKQAK